MSLLSKRSSLGHKVATQKTEPQNMSLFGKWSSLGIEGHQVASQQTEPQNVSLLGKWSSLGHEAAHEKSFHFSARFLEMALLVPCNAFINIFPCGIPKTNWTLGCKSRSRQFDDSRTIRSISCLSGHPYLASPGWSSCQAATVISGLSGKNVTSATVTLGLSLLALS